MLYDTYGFPLDLTRVIAEQHHYALDKAGFEVAMNEQRRRSEFQGSGEVAVAAVFQRIADRVGATRFLGYEKTSASSKVVALLAEGKEVDVVGPYSKDVAVIVAETPFYGEQGGQMGDAGTIASPKARLAVRDCKRPVSTLWVHLAEVESGELRVGDSVELSVDTGRRDDIRRNHSATHLLHLGAAPRPRDARDPEGLAGGARSPPLRLFAHRPLDGRREAEGRRPGERARPQKRATTRPCWRIADARQAGAIAFFGEKYGDTVRVVTMGESKEFCGGTHVARTGDIAFFKLTEETGVAQGVRRVEATTGAGAAAFVRKMEGELLEPGRLLRAGEFEVAARITKLQADQRALEKELEKLRRKLASGGGRDLVAEAREVNGVRVLATRADVADPKALREVADQLRDKLGSCVIVLAGVEGDKIALVAVVSPDLVGKHHAGKIVGEVAKAVGGKGGGRPDMAQGGGSDPAALDAALAKVFDLVRG